jgi:hypothetical protein
VPIARAALALLVFCAAALAAFAQDAETVARPTYSAEYMTRGAQSLTYYAFDADGKRVIERDAKDGILRLTALTPAAKLDTLGICDCDGYVTVAFDTAEQRPDPPGGFTHHIQIWGGLRGHEAHLIHEDSLAGGPGAKVRFFHPHHSAGAARDVRPSPPTTFVSVMNTTDYEDVYLFEGQTQAATKLFSAWDYDLVDLSHDGRYEIVAWQRMTYDLACNFLIEGEHSYPEVYARGASSGKFAKVWPPSTWKNPDPGWWHAERGKLDGGDYQVQGTFVDLRGDKKYELIALVNRASAEHPQWLAAYEFKGGAFVQLALVNVPSQKIMFMINRISDKYVPPPSAKPLHSPTNSPPPHHTTDIDTSPEITVRVATREKCEAGGTLDGTGTTSVIYEYVNGGLYAYHRYIGVQ